MSDLPAEIKVWFSRYPIDYMGTWATTRYPAEAVTYVPKADAEAAVALALEQACEVLDTAGDSAVTEALGQKLCCSGHHCGCQGADVGSFLQHLIRDLAPPAGVAKLAELRAERDGWREGSRVQAMASESLRAERDRLAAANAVLEAKVAGLRDFVDDFAKAKIDALRSSPPYGSSPEDDPDPVVDAETVWAWQADAKAALATQEAGTC